MVAYFGIHAVSRNEQNGNIATSSGLKKAGDGFNEIKTGGLLIGERFGDHATFYSVNRKCGLSPILFLLVIVWVLKNQVF